MADFGLELEKGRSLAEKAAEILDRRADSLARETFEEEDGDQSSILLFRIGEEWYAVRVEDVREIFQEYRMTSVPGVPDFVLGVVNVRGEILSVTDPAKLMHLGFISTDVDPKPPAVVVVYEDRATALLVDEIGDIVEVPNAAVEPAVSTIDKAQAEFIIGSIHVGELMVGLMNTQRVLEPIVTGGRG